MIWLILLLTITPICLILTGWTFRFIRSNKFIPLFTIMITTTLSSGIIFSILTGIEYENKNRNKLIEQARQLNISEELIEFYTDDELRYVIKNKLENKDSTNTTQHE